MEMVKRERDMDERRRETSIKCIAQRAHICDHKYVFITNQNGSQQRNDRFVLLREFMQTETRQMNAIEWENQITFLSAWNVVRDMLQ